MFRSFAQSLRRATLLVCAVAVVPISILPVFAATKTANAAHGYAQRADVRMLVDELVAGHAFDRRQLLRWFAAAEFQPKIIAAMQRPIVEPPKWFEYAPQFLSAERIDGGVAYFRAHEDELARAEREYGVPAEIIVAIVGVETYYGRNTGRYRVFDALTTLAFDYPRRGVFFRSELKDFLLLMQEQGISPLAPKGSFAGAMGVPQFMPGSYRRFAIDFDGDGRIDLWESSADVVGSVAHYLARHDWQAGQPILLPATIDAEEQDAVARKLDAGISEQRPMWSWEADGVTADALASEIPAEPVGVLMLEEQPVNGEERASYWIACPNFYAITRYNRSRLYATAVFQLAQAVKAARQNVGR
ncbi:MAG TPA: lytic murein transglycosylase B [Casimicrobiaceae bacterium]|nr:lytic murein transglycosylase B [Casimicrobiaceae bacterium]